MRKCVLNVFSSPYEELLYISEYAIDSLEDVEKEFSSPYEELLYISCGLSDDDDEDDDCFRPLTRNYSIYRMSKTFLEDLSLSLVFVPLRGITLYIRCRCSICWNRLSSFSFRPLTRNYSIY